MIPKDNEVTNFDFSQYDLYKKCPLSYKWKYIDKRTPKTPPNFYYALPGVTIQKIFEYFYNKEWYRKRETCREFMYSQAPEIFQKTLSWMTVDWKAKIAKKTKSDVYDEFLEMIGLNLDVIKEHKLLGKFAKSEFKIKQFFGNNKYVILTSKIDFLIHNHLGMQILDGKATSSKSTYIKNPAQLFFYAMMYKFQYKKYPDKIGYWFYRTGEITYIDFNDSDIEALQEDIKDILYKIYKKKFDATPEYSACLFCNYRDECLDRIKDQNVRAAEKAEAIDQNDLDSFL
jgi:hypothetical protein